jgi:hypothetical protein
MRIGRKKKLGLCLLALLMVFPILAVGSNHLSAQSVRSDPSIRRPADVHPPRERAETENRGPSQLSAEPGSGLQNGPAADDTSINEDSSSLVESIVMPLILLLVLGYATMRVLTQCGVTFHFSRSPDSLRDKNTNPDNK